MRQTVEGNDLRRRERAIFPHWLDPRIDAGNEGAGDSLDPGIEALPLLLDWPTIEEKPRRLVEGNEAWAEDLGKPAELPATQDVDLPQPQHRGGIALPEEGVAHAAGGDVGDAPTIDGDIERCGETPYGDLTRLPGHLRPVQQSQGKQNREQGRPETTCFSPGIFRHVVHSVWPLKSRSQVCFCPGA